MELTLIAEKHPSGPITSRFWVGRCRMLMPPNPSDVHIGEFRFVAFRTFIDEYKQSLRGSSPPQSLIATHLTSKLSTHTLVDQLITHNFAMFFNKALYAVLAGMAIPMVSAQYGAFIYSCDDISLSNNYLNANCQGNNDYLRLSDCIENQNGELVWSAKWVSSSSWFSQS